MKKILIITLTILMVFSFCSITVLAVTEGEVQSQVAVQGKEKVTGNIFIWFLCAIAFLKATGRENKFESIKNFAIIGFAVGCLLALLMGNGFLVPVLGIAFAYIPVIYVRSTAGTYKKQLNAELETALSIITTSYLRTEDILIAVKENINFINAPVKVSRIRLPNSSARTPVLLLWIPPLAVILPDNRTVPR